MSKYTPGPWYYQEGADTYTHIVRAQERRFICQLMHISGEAEANARLIAAAPEMLAALKAVVAIADRKTDEFDAARAAIAKAEGQSVA